MEIGTLTLLPATSGPQKVASTSDLTLQSDSDAGGGGDLIFQAGATKQGRLLNNGTLYLGPTTLMGGDSWVFDSDTGFIDFAYEATSKKLWARELILRENGNPSHIFMDFANGTYPYGTPVGAKLGDALASVVVRGMLTPYGGTPGVTAGLSFPSISYAGASIAFYAQEDFIQTAPSSNNCNTGTEIRFKTQPTGGASSGGALTRMGIRANGQIGILGSSQDLGILDGFEQGSLAVYSTLRVQHKETAKQLILGNIGPASEAGLQIGNSSGGFKLWQTSTLGVAKASGFGSATRTTIQIAAISGQSATTPLVVFQDSAGSSLFAIGGTGIPRWQTTSNEQTTVGAAGAASALPATPTKYLKVMDSAGTTYVIPVYAAS